MKTTARPQTPKDPGSLKKTLKICCKITAFVEADSWNNPLSLKKYMRFAMFNSKVIALCNKAENMEQK